MPIRTDLDRLAAARPAILNHTEIVVDVDEEERLLAQILGSDGAPTAVRRARRLHPSKRLAASGIGGLGAIGAVTAVLVFSLAGGGTSTAFAGWTADPTTPSSGQLQAAEADCQQTPSRFRVPAAVAATLTSTPTLADIRGPFSLLLYTANDESALCLAGVPTTAGTSSSVMGETPVNGTPAVDPAAILPRLMTGGQSANGSQYWVLEGQVGTSVTAVTLILADGTQIQATTAGGWFAAWWPGAQNAESANITTLDGTNTEPLTPSSTNGTSAVTARGNTASSGTRPPS